MLCVLLLLPLCVFLFLCQCHLRVLRLIRLLRVRLLLICCVGRASWSGCVSSFCVYVCSSYVFLARLIYYYYES